jgi:hypothetical protein
MLPCSGQGKYCFARKERREIFISALFALGSSVASFSNFDRVEADAFGQRL